VRDDAEVMTQGAPTVSVVVPTHNLFLGASVSHEVKCFAVAHRPMSVPISAISFSALYGAMPSICVRSTPPVS
jgi:hypothetical protein